MGAAQRRQRARFVGLHEATVSLDIGAQERRQPPSYLRRHGHILAQKVADGTAWVRCSEAVSDCGTL